MALKTIVFNGWAAGLDTWEATAFRRDRIFSYVEQLDGVPERELARQDELLLVGFSMGSTAALNLVLRFPDRVRGLVLVSATPRMMADADWPGFSERRLAAFRLGAAMTFEGNPAVEYQKENLDRGIEYLRRTDLRGALGRAFANNQSAPRFPVEVLHSERDGIVRPHNAFYFKTLFPHANLTIIPGNEHVLPLHAPALVDQAVARCALKAS